ncbi:MAG: mercuric transporter MerT family protein [Gemmatimonadaceae bacterium]
MRKALLPSAGGVLAALLGSLCCVGPLLFVTLGVGAGLASAFEPLRPLFGTLMVGLFALSFYTVYGRRRATTDATEASEGECVPGAACAMPRSRARDKTILWGAAALALLLWTFPTWSTLFV